MKKENFKNEKKILEKRIKTIKKKENKRYMNPNE
jgi:hypothetical protein